MDLAQARFQRHEDANNREGAHDVAGEINEFDPEMRKKVAAWAEQARKLAGDAEEFEAIDRIVSRAAAVNRTRNTIVHGYQGTSATFGFFDMHVECIRYERHPEMQKTIKGFKQPVEAAYSLADIREASREILLISEMVRALGEIVVWGLDDLPGEEAR